MTRHGQKKRVKWLYVTLPLAVLLLGLGGAWLLTRQGDTGSLEPEIQLASASQLPEKVRRAPPVVQEAYRFAIGSPEILAKFPCYCGCGGMGHKSDLDCFIERFEPDGSIVFADHALQCSICVDIAHDVMRLMRQGKSLAKVRAFIDREYGRFGPPTPTGPVD